MVFGNGVMRLFASIGGLVCFFDLFLQTLIVLMKLLTLWQATTLLLLYFFGCFSHRFNIVQVIFALTYIVLEHNEPGHYEKGLKLFPLLLFFLKVQSFSASKQVYTQFDTEILKDFESHMSSNLLEGKLEVNFLALFD